MAGTKDYLIEFVGTIDKEIKSFNKLYKIILLENDGMIVCINKLRDYGIILFKPFYDFINENTDDVFDTYLTLHDNNKSYYREKLTFFLFIARPIFE